MSSWSSNYKNEPAGSASFGVTDNEIRALKVLLEAIITKEHVLTYGETIETGNTGTLLHGSGKAYYQDTPPTVRPNGDAFDDTDTGRMWYKTIWAVAGANELGDGRFGWYILIKIATDTYRWLPAQGNDPIGTRKPHDESAQAWVDPTASTGWYTTGTNPGWIKCEGGGSYTRPQGSFTIPDDKGLVMKGNDGGTDGATGGTDEITITEANLPPHGHAIDFSGSDVSIDPGGAHTHRINKSGNIGAGSGEGLDAVFVHNAGSDADSIPTTSSGTHTHTGSLTDMPEATEVTDENGDAFDNDPLTIDPPHRNITWVLRIY